MGMNSVINNFSEAFNRRAAATYVFLGGNLTFLFGKAVEGGLAEWDIPRTVSAMLLIGASFCYKPSEKNPRWLYAAGSSVLTAQGIIAATADGGGAVVQQLGAVPPSLQGALLIRSAWNQTHNGQHYVADKIYKKPLEFIDRYPIFSGAAIEAPGVALLSVGAALSGDVPLALGSAQWFLANVFLGSSDPRIDEISRASRRVVNHVKSKTVELCRSLC